MAAADQRYSGSEPYAAFRVTPRPEHGFDPTSFLESSAKSESYRRSEEIYAQGDAADYGFLVVSGATRKCSLMANGRQQIIEFLLPGDFFGFNARTRHEFSVEAITDGTLLSRFPRREIESMADSTPQLSRMIREIARAETTRLQSRILILGRTTALGKIGAFLVEMSDRTSERDAEGVVLPMSRYDIADYLVLAVETVSRALTVLKHRGTISLIGARRIRIMDRSALEDADEDLRHH
jgi:CRP/FNR family nitrogen fixation transcriptional regulator